MALKLGSGLGLVLVIAVFALVLMNYMSQTNYMLPKVRNVQSAKLPCLADNHCPMGQKCSRGFCSEGFMAPIIQPTDAASCTAKECQGINAPCARNGSPCQEGTFCQNNKCVSIAAPDQGEAYNQIGMILP